MIYINRLLNQLRIAPNSNLVNYILRMNLFKTSKTFLSFILTLLCLTNVRSASGVEQQKFDIEPYDKFVKIGEKLILPCRVVNKQGLLQWTRDGFGLGHERDLAGYPRYQMIGTNDEGDYSLYIRSATLEDDAVFQCQVGGMPWVKSIRSRTATVNVLVPPNQPKIVQGNYLKTTAGSKIELTCQSDGGKPASAIKWYDGKGNRITTGIKYTTQPLDDGKRANAISKWAFEPTPEYDGQTITCQAENPALSEPTKEFIKLDVKYPPNVKLIVNQSKILENDDVQFVCESIANPPPTRYLWYKNDELLVGDYSDTLSISKVTREFNKVSISCEVTNLVGSTRASHKLDIHFGPVFKTPLESVYNANEGEDVKLKCDVEGNPKPEISWLFNESTQVLGKDTHLLISKMRSNKIGRYTCRASVKGFPEQFSDFYVFVKGPPKIISPLIQHAIEGQPAQIECFVYSAPLQNNIVWAYNSQIVNIDNNNGYEMIEKVLPSQSLIQNILKIEKPKDKDFGAYNCSVWNEFGYDNQTIILVKQKSLPMLLIVAVIIGLVVLIVSITIVIMLCLKRKSSLTDDYQNEVKNEVKNTNSANSINTGKQNGHVAMDSGSSGADSDIKVEIRTASSLSDRGHWDDLTDSSRDRTITANGIPGMIENIYNYASEPVFSTPKDTSNHNGYIPYVDYNRDYLPPPPHQTQSLLSTQENGLPLQHTSFIMSQNRDPNLDPHYGTLDSRYRSTYQNPFLRNYNMTNGSIHNQPSLNLNQSGIYSTSPRYITTPLNGSLKTSTLATHV